MAENDKGAWSAQWTALIAILLATGGAIFYVPALNSARPDATPGKPVTSLGYEDREARLWQDPFQAAQPATLSSSESISRLLNAEASDSVSATRPATTSPSSEPTSELAVSKNGAATQNRGPTHNWGDLSDQMLDAAGSGSLTVMPVMVQAGPYAEMGEQRLRTRVAVLDALACNGYAPDDPEHIGNVNVGWDWKLHSDSNSGWREITDALSDGPGSANLLIPYEWCHKKGKQFAILILWINENAFSDIPLTRLGALCAKISDGCNKSVHFKIIGPRVSSELRSMALEAALGLNQNTITALSNARMFSATATAAEDLLIANLPSSEDRLPHPPANVAELIDERLFPHDLHGPFLTRLTLTDAELCRDVIGELERREGMIIKSNVATVHKAETSPRVSNVAIVCEWDTFYARALIKSFQHEACGVEAGDPDWVFTRYYLRGIDGQVPSEERHKAEDSQSKNTDAKSDKSTAYMEQPEGISGLDYLRRIADDLAAVDARLRATSGGDAQNGLRAVGVLGNDVYDKLLVMTALRARLPDVQFFTIAMDARYTMASEWPEDHNLIICSSFGLKLNDFYQWAMPPFRDGTQTAAFAEVRFATAERGDPILTDLPAACAPGQSARLFEIGRHGPEELSTTSPKVHPEREQHLAWLSSHWGLLIRSIVLLAALLGLPILLGVRPEKIQWSKTLTYTVPFLVFAVPVTLLITFCLYTLDDPVLGEPFEWVNGTSIWPTELVRLLVIALCIHFFFRIHRVITENEKTIEREFLLSNCSENLKEPQDSINAMGEPTPIALRAAELGKLLADPRRWPELLKPLSLSGWAVYGPYADKSLNRDFKVRDKATCFEDDELDAAGNPKYKVYAQNLWWEYKRRSGWHRVFRVLVMSAIYIGTALVGLDLLGMPKSPARSLYAQSCDHVITYLTIFAAIPLTFFVLDATYLNKRFIEHLMKQQTHWPYGAFDGPLYKDIKLGIQLTEYLDIQFIAIRTDAVGDIIYYPFLIFFLMIVSRNAFFDNWDWTPGLLAVLAGNVTLAITGALMLRGAAEDARKCALADLQIRRRKFLAAADRDSAKVAVTLIDEVKNEGRGAFSLLSQHPYLAAILLPSGSIGVWAILDYFAKSGG